ncbi:MAG: SDR family NAD(P)-dependent oxidoreductase [Atopobiaceae bacterium]|nr:SDR family NAD(P)-dependent oxidoreductase [Atopobiaceae bacterium]
MKTWLITGASTGIGRGIAEAVLADGNRAVVTARDVARLSDLVERYPQTALALPYEATESDAAKRLVDAAIERFGSIDTLVCNAGRGHSGTAKDSSLTDVRTLFETNFFGPAALVQAALPSMRTTGNGVIATVSSMGVHFRGASGNGFYVASKAAIEGYSEILRNEVAQFGIRVCVIEPGSFRTEFRKAGINSNINASTYASAARSRDYLRDHPYDQAGDPVRGGRIIADVLGSDDVPHTLILGKGMVEVAVAAHEERAREAQWSNDLASQASFSEEELAAEGTDDSASPFSGRR